MSWGRMHIMEKWVRLQVGVMRDVLEVNKEMCVLKTALWFPCNKKAHTSPHIVSKVMVFDVS